MPLDTIPQNKSRAQGPAEGALNIGRRIITIVISMVETRLKLAVLELEEEKKRIIQLMIVGGITLLLAAFGLMSLLVLVFLAIDPVYRLTAIAITTGTLLLFALIGAIWTWRKASCSTLLSATREQLEADKALLEKK